MKMYTLKHQCLEMRFLVAQGTPTDVPLVYGCFLVTMSRLSSCNRDGLAQKA